MKRKLQDIVQEKFTYEDTHLLLPDMDLNFTAIENELFEGTFSFHSSNEQPIRGIVRCEHPCITCLDTEFNGTDLQIRFQYADSHRTEGMTDEGVFVITSNVGEYLLPFRANITRHYLMSSIGKIKTLNDFTNLCKLSWKEALQIFKSPYFCNILHHDSGYQKLLYRGLTEKSCGAAQMEEFLIGCEKKERNRITVNRPQRTYKAGREIQTDLLDVEKSTWGYLQAELSCDAAFVRLEKKQLRFYDFVGKHAEIQYQILPANLHAGKNYARIEIRTAFQTETVELTVTVPKEKSRGISNRWENLYIRSQMEKCYLDYRREQLSRELWMQEMQVLLKRAADLDAQNEWLSLYRMFVLLNGGDQAGADAIAKTLPKNIQNQRTPLGAFYVYLTTIGDTPSYIRDVTKRVKEIYLKYPSHPVLVWILLHIDEALLRNPERKYQWIKKYMTGGSISPIFYDEAACLLENHPDLLSRFDVFERRLLVWMLKQNRLSAGILASVQALAQTQKTFDAVYFRILCRCYKRDSDAGIMKTICTYLIKCNRYGDVYFPWFQRGVTRELKIAGLYEAYMLSWTKASGALPEVILHYFARSRSLPAKRRAMLYAYVVRKKEHIGKLWNTYWPLMREFAEQELKKEHISEDLAVLYEEVKKQVSEHEWNAIRNTAQEAYRLRIQNPDMTEIHVLQADSKTVQKVAVYEQSTYIYLHTKPFVILYEDRSGGLYAAGKQFHLKKMLSGTHVYQMEQSQEKAALQPEQMTDRAELSDLLKQFAAPMSVMWQRIREAKKQDLDTADAEEKLMVAMLFTGQFLPEHEKLFARLAERKGEPLILQAYVIWFSRQYVCGEESLPTAVREFLLRGLLEGSIRQKFAKAAFLKQYAKDPQEKEDALAEKLLEQFVLRGMYFPFYQDLPVKLQRHYLLFGDRTISCVTRPGQTLQVTWISKEMGEKRPSAGMQEVLPGIYTCVLHTYVAEALDYEITSSEGELIEQGTLQVAQKEAYAQTRFGRLEYLMEKRDKQSAFEYAERTDLADALFQPIEE